MHGKELRRLVAARDQINRIYADDRFTGRYGGRLRTFAVTTVWAVSVDPGPGATWRNVADRMGLSNWELWKLVREDAPRYEPPNLHERNGCAAPKPRAGGRCGKSPQISFRVTDPGTGAWQIVGFCSRHSEYADMVRRAETELTASGAVPEPLPNRGGLLPCYIDCDWPDLYAKARRGWTPPRVGIRADDWPVMEKVAAAEPPALRLITGDAHSGRGHGDDETKIFLGGVEMDAPDLPQGDDTAPRLRLVTTAPDDPDEQP